MSIINDKPDTIIPGFLTCHISLKEVIEIQRLVEEARLPKVTFTGVMEDMEKEAQGITKHNLEVLEQKLKEITKL